MWPLISMFSCCVVALMAALFHYDYVHQLKKEIKSLENTIDLCSNDETKAEVKKWIENIKTKLL